MFMSCNETFINLIREYASLIGINFDLVYRIQIVVYNRSIKWAAKVVPIDINEQLHFF